MTNQYERVTLHVPATEIKKYNAIFKALGLKIEKKNAIERALDDIEAGRVHTYGSIDEMLKAII